MNLLRVDELYSMVQVKMQMRKLKLNLREDQQDLKFCYDILQDVSRSFASVIIQLHDELRDAVCIFYLVLRGLDTIEDDMNVSIAVKKQSLPKFHEKLLSSDWHIDGIGKGQERVLLEQFFRVSREWQLLKKAYRDIISDICEKMANGMCHYLDNEVVTKKDYDMYCHYVAGLVGHGLTRLFAASGLEDSHLADDLRMSNSMGLFLQKTNIIRDYLEDIMEEPPRMFWPREIWGLYAKELNEFKRPENMGRALECLNHLIADALTHLPDCVEYMASLKEPSVFLFCAIPQVMAIATLAKLYNNAEVFTSKVKIRKGVACKIILQCGNLKNALQLFSQFMVELESKLKDEDPSFDAIRVGLYQGKQHLRKYLVEEPSYARSWFTKYPALGGEFLYTVVDGVGGFFKR